MTDRSFSISSFESDREEWKAAFTDDSVERALQTVCGFLNAFGGRLVFGVDPHGNPVPLAGDLDELQRRIHDRMQAHLRPNARQYVDMAAHDGRIYVFVRPDQSRIYQYRHVTYKRTGSSTHPLTHEQAKELEDSRKDHVRETAPGMFTRVAEGEALKCQRCGYSEITGMSIGVSVGQPPKPKVCPECGTPLARA
jgi:predicted HTH transcriptional regulator